MICLMLRRLTRSAKNSNFPEWLCRSTGVGTRIREQRHHQDSRVDTAIGAEKPIPEEVDHGEIAVPIAVVNEMELLLSPEPRKAAEPRSRNMILVIDIVMSAE
jgi:hypothetical protein